MILRKGDTQAVSDLGECVWDGEYWCSPNPDIKYTNGELYQVLRDGGQQFDVKSGSRSNE